MYDREKTKRSAKYRPICFLIEGSTNDYRVLQLLRLSRLVLYWEGRYSGQLGLAGKRVTLELKQGCVAFFGHGMQNYL